MPVSKQGAYSIIRKAKAVQNPSTVQALLVDGIPVKLPVDRPVFLIFFFKVSIFLCLSVE